jgi:hypothetical protein
MRVFGGMRVKRVRRGRGRIRYLAAAAAVVGLLAVAVPQAQASGIPKAPSDVRVVYEDADSVKVAFVDNSTTEDFFMVDRSQTRDGGFTHIKTYQDNGRRLVGRTIQVEVPKVGPIDCYRVRAGNIYGDGISARACIGPTRSATFDFRIQKPWDLPESARYTYASGSNTHMTTVLPTDKPHTPDSDTAPRTEMRWNNEYSSGAHMWESDVYVPSGTDGPSVMQVKHLENDTVRTTDFQLRVYAPDGGTFRRYSNKNLKTGVYNKWWNVKVVHNANTGWVHVYISDVLVDSFVNAYQGMRVFKNGVYQGGSTPATAYFRDLRYWVE